MIKQKIENSMINYFTAIFKDFKNQIYAILLYVINFTIIFLFVDTYIKIKI